MRRVITGALALLLAALTGCGLGNNPLGKDGDAPADARPLVVATVEEPERMLLAHLYAEALAGHKFAVTVKTYPGRQNYLDAMIENKVQIAPEYTAELLLYFDQSAAAKNPKEAAEALPKAIDATMQVLQPASTGSTIVYVTSPDVAQKESLTALDHIAQWASTATLEVPPDLQLAPYGPPGLEGVYRAKFHKVTPVASAAKRTEALLAGKSGLTTVRSTNPIIDSLVKLDDPEGLTPGDQSIIPVVRRELPDAARDIINKVNAKLTDKQLLDLTGQNGEPGDIAKKWLASQDMEVRG